MAKYVLILSLLIASAFAAAYSRFRIDPNGTWKVVGGKPAEEGAHPHQISLMSSGSHFCGGSIVHTEWVITAAHCVSGESTANMTVVAGSNSLNKGGVVYKVLEIHSHEDYSPFATKNDVAILKVQPISFNDKVRPIAAETEDVGGEEPCVLSGWGTTSYPGSIPNELQELALKTTTVKECNDAHASPVIETQICTLTKEGEGACHGDSGGPLVREVNGEKRLIGAVSWGRPCGVGFPDVYSRISSFVDWFNKECNNCLNN